MTTITITLPDDLAKQAEEKGLLSQTAIESYVRDRLQESDVEKGANQEDGDIATIGSNNFDYTKWRENLWEGLTAQELFARAAQNDGVTSL